MGADPATARRYSLVAARWEELCLAADRGQTTPADDTRLRELTQVITAMSGQLGFKALTDANGFLPGDPQRIICESWQEAAEGW